MTKYRAVKTEVDGIVFASRKEANRYLELRLLLRAGLIEDLKLQPKYPLYVGDTKVCDYVADFAYIDKDMKRVVIEDAKGFLTPIYRLKKKMFHAFYRDWRITEV